MCILPKMANDMNYVKTNNHIFACKLTKRETSRETAARIEQEKTSLINASSETEPTTMSLREYKCI